MGIWIRSQNKEVLASCQNIEYTENNAMSLIIEANGSRDTVLGTYKDHKRAIEVLGEIQKTISDYGVSVDMEGTTGNIIHAQAVYQMPDK